MILKRSPKRHYLMTGATIYILALPVFIWLADGAYPVASRILAWLLFVLGSLPALIYVSYERDHVPIIELVLLAYVLAFSLPVFYESQLRIYVRTISPEDVPVTLCIALAIVAVGGLWLGYRAAPTLLRKLPVPRLQLRCGPDRLFYYALILAIFSLMKTERYDVFEQVVRLVISQDLAIAILALLYYKGSLTQLKKAVTLVLVLALVLKGISSGLTQSMLQPLLIWFVCRWLVIKKFEWSILAVGVLAIVLIQPVKLQYREMVWFGDESMGYVDKLGIFSDLMVKHWFSGTPVSSAIAESTANRMSLLLQTSHVIDWTPNVVPYENGRTLWYFVVGWVPRFMWPDKPMAQEANVKYAIHYGVTSEEGIRRTMFGVGELGEAYMNFGVLGIIPIFILLGLFSYLPVHVIQLPAFRRSVDSLARRWLCRHHKPLSWTTSRGLNACKASHSDPASLRTPSSRDTESEFAIDWSDVHRPTSTPACDKAVARRDTEYAGPPYFGNKLATARKTLKAGFPVAHTRISARADKRATHKETGIELSFSLNQAMIPFARKKVH